MRLKTITLGMLCAFTAMTSYADKYVGGDISMLPEYEEAGAVYYDHDGNSVSSALDLFKSEGMNAMRVRLFVNPQQQTASGATDTNVCQDLDYVKTLGKRIKDAGLAFYLDLHYSDTWADPSNQWTPAAWQSLSDTELQEQVYSYTKEVLTELSDAGAMPDLISTGNEISYGMLWGTYVSNVTESNTQVCWPSSSTSHWDRFGALLTQAVKACRDAAPDAKIILHCERVATETQTNSTTLLQADNANYAALTNFYSKMAAYGIDYDIIGLSYYPYYHGAISSLKGAIESVADYGKEVMVVETGYPYAWAVQGTTYDYTATYPYSEDGQKQFTDDLITMLNDFENVTGLFWWWMEYNAYNTSLSGWYNAALFNSSNGRAYSALSSLQDFLEGSSGVAVVAEDVAVDGNSVWYDTAGMRVGKPNQSGIYINNGHKFSVSK